MPCNVSRLHSHARLSERYFCYYLLLPLGDGRTTIEMSDHILISMALYYRGHDIHAKVVLMAKRTETCPYCLIPIRDNTIMIGQAVRSVQLDRLRVVRRGISAPWLMQPRRTRYLCPSFFGGTSALLPEPDRPSDHTRTAQNAQTQGLDSTRAHSGAGAAGHLSVTL
jgi:hypothetical protein